MKLSKLKAAMAEAERFLEKAKAAQEASKDSSYDCISYNNPRENGAVRRASMDLTRALADLRKPN